MAGARLRKWLNLNRDEKRWLVQACIALPIVRLALSLTSIRTVSRGIGWASRWWRPNSAPRPEKIVWAVAAAGARIPLASTCLSRALTAHLILQREGVASRVRLGVSRDSERGPRAHAWLELGDAPMDSRDAGFSAFALDLGTL